MLPGVASQPARGRGADALPRLRLSLLAHFDSRRGRALACVFSGLVCGLAFPPADLGPLILLAMVPLLWAWRAETPRWAALYGFLFGLGFFGFVLDWSRYFGAVAIVPLVVGQSAFVAGAGALVAALQRRRLGSPWTIAVVWVVMEALRARVPFGGLAWGEVGVALHDLPPARALASIGGVPLVSFVVVACNALLLDAALSQQRRSSETVRRSFVGLGALAAITLLVTVTWYEPTVTQRLRFALLQGNDQNRDLTAEEFADDYLMRKHLELASKLHGPYDLIVFPESSLERDPEEFPDVRDALSQVGREHGAVILVNARHRADGKLYNANLVYNPDGSFQGFYAKQHLVPFGEYVPFRDQLSFIGELEQVPYDFDPGKRRVLFSVRGQRFATVICFESAFGPLVRDFVHDGADFIVVTTNNRSYRRSGLSAQHVALSQMRAAETARPVLHASISGISAVVDDRGDVHDTSELFVNRITRGTIPAATGETLYVRFGDWALSACSLALVALAAIAAARARHERAVDSPVQ